MRGRRGWPVRRREADRSLGNQPCCLVGPWLESCLLSSSTTSRDVSFQLSFPMNFSRSLAVKTRSRRFRRATRKLNAPGSRALRFAPRTRPPFLACGRSSPQGGLYARRERHREKQGFPAGSTINYQILPRVRDRRRGRKAKSPLGLRRMPSSWRACVTSNLSCAGPGSGIFNRAGAWKSSG